MSVYAQFESTITAADQLIAMYSELRRGRGLGTRGRLDAENTDLLWLPRSAVVISLSALDSYIHYVLYEKIPVVLTQAEVPDPLCKMFSTVIPIKNEGTFKKALPFLKAHDSCSEISARLKDKTLSFLSFQAPDKIIEGYELIGYPRIFDDVAALWTGPRTSPDDIKNTLSNYVKRRNQIAHEGDQEADGSPRPMQPQYAADCRQFVGNLVSRMNRVVYGI